MRQDGRARSGQDQRASWAHSSGDRSSRSSTSTSDLQEHVGTSGRYSTDGDKYDDDDEKWHPLWEERFKFLDQGGGNARRDVAGTIVGDILI